MILLVVLLVGAVVVVSWAVIAALAYPDASQPDHDPQASELHGSDDKFGNSLRGDNSNFGRGFYDE